MGHLLCWAIDVAYGFLASDGTVILPESTTTSAVIEVGRRMLAAVSVLNHKFVMEDRGETYEVNHDMLLEFLNDLLPCVFYTEKVTQVDGDYLKHAIGHALILLL